MSKIQVGDEVYFLKDTLDFRLYQVKVTIYKIRSVPTLGKTRIKLYYGYLGDGSRINSYYCNLNWQGRKRLIRKTPFPGMPILTTQQEIMEFTTRKEKT